jgi:cytoskeleton protein RodZ
MESLGEILKTAREKRNLTVEQIARDTRISRRYIEALEMEDFAAFPGETYLIGFLRNYADYLSLPRDELVALYRNIKIQEQPLPMVELLANRHTPPLRLLVIAGAAVLVLVVGGLVLLLNGRTPSTATAAAAPSRPRGAEEVVFQSDALTQWFSEKDVISVAMGDRRYRVEVTTVSDRRVELTVPGGMVRLSYSEDRFVDLDLDSRPDLKIVFNDIDLLQAKRRVNLGLARIVDGAAASVTAPAKPGEGATATATTPGKMTPVPAVAAAPLTDATDKQIILTADAPSVFAVNADFRGSTLFRYLSDETARDQRFFQKGETFVLDNIQRQIRLWISNAGAVRLTVQGREVPLGRPGQVVTKIVRWTRQDGTGKYQLEVGSVF